jgi:hypothetical protein
LTAALAWSADVAAAREPTLDRAAIVAVAREVAALLRRSAEPGDGMLTAAQVAARFNVDRSWVYAHAEELGVVRLGNGPRPRLRFDPAIVSQRLVATRGRNPSARPSLVLSPDLPLLPIKRSRRRRRLDPE